MTKLLTMQKHLPYYVKIYSNVLDNYVCDQTLADLKQVKWIQHQYSSPDDYTVSALNANKELSVTRDIISTTNNIEDKVWHCLKDYVTTLDFPWLRGWRNFSNIRFNKYEVGQLMNIHCDHINTLFDGEEKGVPILTVLGMLNDDYEGGELVMFDDSFIKMDKGDIVVFPSNFLFPHRVLPVTFGTRHSFVSWAW